MTIRLANNNPVIFVDDDEVELLLAQKYMERSALTNPMLGFTSGEEFLKHMERVASGDEPMPALVLVDGRMAPLDGWEVVRALRSQPVFNTVPIVSLFSNSDDPTDRARALEAGADEYLVKPGDGPSFLAMLNSFAPEAGGVGVG